MKTRQEVRECIIEAIKDVLPDSTGVGFDDSTDPIRHLGLDSFDGVACACSMSDKLGYEIPPAVNPFVDDEKKRSRCISEMVDLLTKLLTAKEANFNE